MSDGPRFPDQSFLDLSPGAEGGDSPKTEVDFATIALIDAPTAPQLLELTEYWRGKCRGERLPARSAINPAEIVKHLPWIFMVDVLDGGADYRYRLLGTGIVAANYRDATGRTFRELYDTKLGQLASARLGFDRALRSAAPAYTGGRAFWRPNWSFDRFESAFLPLTSDGATIDIVLGEIAYFTPV